MRFATMQWSPRTKPWPWWRIHHSFPGCCCARSAACRESPSWIFVPKMTMTASWSISRALSRKAPLSWHCTWTCWIRTKTIWKLSFYMPGSPTYPMRGASWSACGRCSFWTSDPLHWSSRASSIFGHRSKQLKSMIWCWPLMSQLLKS